MNRFKAATDSMREIAAVYVGLVVLGAVGFMVAEGSTFADSLYWAGTTATSTGYGDISPKTTAGRIIAVALMHVSILVIMPLIVVQLLQLMIEDRNAFTHEEQVRILDGISRIEQRLQRLEEQDGPRGPGDPPASLP